jgi:hypothetical protein
MQGMLIVLGVGLLLSGIVGMLFPRQIAEFVIRAFRRMGGEVPDPGPASLFTVAYRIIGVVYFSLGIAVIAYQILRP